nr:ATP-binding protein [Streptomyces sp. HB202]
MLVSRLKARLDNGGPAALVGPPGSGKTSLLQAGLLPALAAGVLPESGSWPGLFMRAAARPMATLVDGLAERTGLQAASLVDALAADTLAGVAVVRKAIRATVEGSSPRLVVVVDQLEDLLHLVRDEEERRTFLDTLSALAVPGPNGEPPAALVVFSLSTASAESWFEYPQLLAALRDPVLLGPMSVEGLRSAIRRPAEMEEMYLEDGLVEVLLHDLPHVRPASQLPLLQLTLWSLWQGRSGGRMTIDAYRMTGGFAGIGATYAERIYQQLSANERLSARSVFLQLIRSGKHTQPIPRPAAWDTLYHEDSAATDTLLRGRLLVRNNDLVEIANFRLLSGWPRLREWLDCRQEIEDAVSAWEDHDRHPDWLFRGDRLAEAISWAPDVPHARAFLEASLEARRHLSWLRRGIAVVVVAVLTVALVLLMSALPAANGRWSVGALPGVVGIFWGRGAAHCTPERHAKSAELFRPTVTT